uniref:MBD domain-containing protein n=1 Tax=Strigamia maritima TaxID=126957 RepID=T1ITV8_STRMM
MLLQVISGFHIIVHLSLTQFKEDNAVLSDYNHSQAVVINLEVSFCSKLIRGHCQCHWNYIRGQTSNLQANDNGFHAHSSREAIGQCCARIERDRFRRDLANNSGGSRWLACGRKSRLFHRNSRNGFLLIFDHLKHSSLPRMCERTRADHYNVQLVAEGGFNPGTREKLPKISVWAIKAQHYVCEGYNEVSRSGWTIDVQLLLEEKGLWKFARGKQVEPLATASAAEREKYEKDKNKSRAIVLQCLVPRLQPAAMKHDTRNLISVGKIDQAKFKVYKSDSKICSLYRKLDNGLYKVQGPVQFRSANLGSSFDTKSNVNLTKPENCCSETGSMGKFESHAVSSSCLASEGIDLKEKVHNTVCDNCELSKSTRASFKSDNSLLTKNPLELLHMDLWGPCKIPSLGGARFLYCIKEKCPVSTTLLKPTSSKRGFHRTSVPNKSGWEREEVQHQSGATKGQWDIYFYAPGRRFPLRSRPEIREYCEKTLNVPYNPEEFSWKPTEASINTVSPVDTDNEEVKEPSFEEAMASPEKDEWVSAMKEELDTLEEHK